MDELNAKKQELLKNYKIFVILAVVCLLLGFISFFFPLIIVGFVLIIIVAFKADKIRKLDFEFKGQIMNGLANKYFDEASYIPNSYISKEEYRESENSGTGDNFNCVDTIKGKLNNKEFDASSIYITETHNNGKQSYTVTLFNGLFIRIKTNKIEKGKVKLSEKDKKSFFDGYKRVEFESVEFNDKFNCIATDEHLAFYLTNPKMMEVLLELEKKYPGNFYLLYKDGLLYLLIDGISLNFKVKLTELYTNELIEEYKQSLVHIKSMIEAI